jgi:hypothetical protein
MAKKIVCDVTNCVYNENSECTRKNIRVMSNTPEATSNETISCMSFRAMESKEANQKPELVESNK